MKIFLKYLLIQIPQWIILGLFLWLLFRRTPVPAWAAGAFFVFWVIKDLGVFPWVRRAYSNDAQTGAEKLIGSLAVTQKRLDPVGYVKINGELWKARARFDQQIGRGKIVRVYGADGLTLIVEPEIAIAETGRSNLVRIVGKPNAEWRH